MPAAVPSFGLDRVPLPKTHAGGPSARRERVTNSDFGVVAPSDATRSTKSKSFRHGSGPGFARGEFERGGALTVLALDRHEPEMNERAGGQELACGRWRPVAGVRLMSLASEPYTTRPRLFESIRRQSLKGISNPARGSHLQWLPRVNAPMGIQSCRDCLTRRQEGRPRGQVSVPGRPCGLSLDLRQRRPMLP